MIKVHLNSNFIKDSLSTTITGEIFHVANVHVDSIERVFEIGQNIHYNWTESHLVENISSIPQRSISAGDVLQDDEGTYWLICLTGFKIIKVVKFELGQKVDIAGKNAVITTNSGRYERRFESTEPTEAVVKKITGNSIYVSMLNSPSFTKRFKGIRISLNQF